LGIRGGEFSAFCREHDIEIINSLPWNPKGNAIAETSVRIVKNALRSYCLANNCKNNWPQYLWLICNQINALVLKSTNSSAELFYGRINNLGNKSDPAGHFRGTNINERHSGILP
jgi:transposase InsO family protein